MFAHRKIMTIKEQIMADMKASMKAHDTARLSAIRMLMDAEITAIIAKLVKQRHDSIEQYRAANRMDLADKESAEIDVLSAYLPKPLSEEEILAIIDEAIVATGASGMAAMGKVMGMIKPKLTGRADLGKVSALIKQKLTA